MLLLCPWVAEVWASSPLKIEIAKRKISRIEIWMYSTLASIRGSDLHQVQASSLFGFICWNIWKAGNSWVFVFVGIVPSLLVVISKSILANSLQTPFLL